jgi:uncharacterized protein YtpQ (UPF0354 family)
MIFRVGILLGFLVSLPAVACEITAQQVQSAALNVLKKEYPAESFARGKDVEVILWGEVEFGLQNLRSRLCLADPRLNAAAQDELMRSHFKAMIALTKEADSQAPRDWAEAQKIVTLQFMSSDYARLFKDARTVVTHPFVAGVELAVVLTQKNGYGYVREADRAKWKVEKKVLFETALRNLDLQHPNAKLQGGADPNRFLAFEEKDGYDAIRLLVPWVRQEAAKYLGDPFLAAIPNRDFLVMWSTRNSADFQTYARNRAQGDFKSQPYPLTPRLVKVWADGRVELQP